MCIRDRVYWGTIGLMSKSGIRETIKQCETNAPGMTDWGTLIFDLCWRSIDELRKPQPIQAIGENRLSPDSPTYQLYPILQKNEPTILYGDAGTGKSMFAVLLGTLVDNDISLHGMQPTQGKVVYVDWETTSDAVWERVWAIKNGLFQTDELIPHAYAMSYLRATGPLHDWGRELIDRLLKHKADMVILDSLGIALAGRFNDAEAVTGFFQTLRELEITSLIIDHVGKAEGSAELGPIGSVYKKGLSRSVWELRRVDEDEGFRVALFHRKVNRGRKHRPIGFKIDIAEGTDYLMDQAVFSPLTVRESEGMAEGLSLRERLHRLLATGPLHLKDIYESLEGVHQTTVRKTLGRYFQQTPTRGVWALKAQQAEPDPEQAAMDVR